MAGVFAGGICADRALRAVRLTPSSVTDGDTELDSGGQWWPRYKNIKHVCFGQMQ